MLAKRGHPSDGVLDSTQHNTGAGLGLFGGGDDDDDGGNAAPAAAAPGTIALPATAVCALLPPPASRESDAAAVNLASTPDEHSLPKK